MTAIDLIDDKLIERAWQIGRHKTKKAVVTEALEEYILRRQQLDMVGLFHRVEFDPDYDYKEQRRRS
ncbi:MAG: type II toxin-antitoxin system VapB family antitoxin [Desulfuromonadaceae bacterium]|nr:type II toxin-antitoxin system VapB family antitoxin [Desulfuromonadaceae bacterium]